jgi:hypothetical protein
MKWGEVATKHRTDAARVVGAKGDDASGDSSAAGKQEPVAGIDGVKEMGLDGLSGAHRVVPIDAEGERSSGRDCAGLSLTAGCGGRQQEECSDESAAGMHDLSLDEWVVAAIARAIGN